MKLFRGYLAKSGRPALTAVTRRKRGTILTSLGVAMGIFALVAMLAMSTTVQTQVSSRFTDLMATKVAVSGIPDSLASEVAQAHFNTSQSEAASQHEATLATGIKRVRALNGVKTAGFLLKSSDPLPVRVAPGTEPLANSSVMLADAETLVAHRLHTVWGQPFDSGHVQRSARVAFIGTTVARQLGIDNSDSPRQIHVGNASYAVAGVFSSPDPGDGFDDAIVLPLTSGADSGGQFTYPQFVVSTEPGFARQVSVEAPIAFDPYQRYDLTSEVPPDPENLREQVSGDTQTMVYAFGIVALIIGALSISNTMLSSVFQRRHEIGVRSALGATSHNIVSQIVTEGVMIGAFGGLAGAINGFNAVLIFALVQNWTAVIPLWLIPCGIILGACVGGISSVYPALKAARIDPVEALMG